MKLRKEQLPECERALARPPEWHTRRLRVDMDLSPVCSSYGQAVYSRMKSVYSGHPCLSIYVAPGIFVMRAENTAMFESCCVRSVGARVNLLRSQDNDKRHTDSSVDGGDGIAKDFQRTGTFERRVPQSMMA